MRKKVILPFDDKPYSLMYHGSAFPLGIIQGNTTEDLTPWLSSKYINCWFAPTWENKFAYYVTDQWATGDKILLQQRIDLFPKQYDLIFQKDVLFLFRKMLDGGYYPHGAYNEEYIVGKKWFGKEYHLHDFILIGYDDIRRCFISDGYLQDKQFQRYVIPYDNMKMAIQSCRTAKVSFNFWKYNDKAQYEFSPHRLIMELSDYLQSNTSMKIFTHNRIWGMDAVNELGEHILSTCEIHNRIDNRYTRGIMEHKFFMRMRIEFLLKHNYISDKEYQRYANNIFDLCERAHLLGIKYRLNRNKDIPLHIYHIIQETVLLEKEYLPSVLSDLKNNIEEDIK